jgi:dienelactone hydrolase
MFPAVRLTLCLAFAAAAFCADYQIEANIRYGPLPENVLDIVQSPAPALKNRPGVIVIHGDGQKEGVIEQFCVPLIKHGFVVANLEYRSQEPAPIADVMAAAQWFHNHAARFKVDPGQILALGEGSGGTLALLLAGLGPVTGIVAVINFYGAAPTAAVRRGLPPILTIRGDADPQSVQQTEVITVPGGKDGLTPDEMAKLWPQIFKWLKKHKVVP